MEFVLYKVILVLAPNTYLQVRWKHKCKTSHKASPCPQRKHKRKEQCLLLTFTLNFLLFRCTSCGTFMKFDLEQLRIDVKIYISNIYL